MNPPDLFDPPPVDDGPGLRDQALGQLEDHFQHWLADCRRAMRWIALDEGRLVTADDARKWLARQPDYQPPKGGRLNWFGAVFKGDDWEPVGWHQSTHPGNHARPMRTWRYIGGET